MEKQMKLFTYMTKPFVLFVLLFAMGVGEMWAGTKTVYVETTQCSTYDNVYIHYWDDGSGDQVATQITDYFWMASIPENAKWCVFRKVDGTGYNYLENVTNSDNFFYVVSFDQSKGNSHATTHLKTYDGSTYVYWRTNPEKYNAWGDDNATLQIRLIRLDGDNLGFVNATDKDATSDHVARYLVPAGTYIRPELHTTKNNAYSKTFEFSSTATDNFIYNFTNDGGWANWATTFFARTAYVYFDNTNSQWTNDYKEIMIGRDGTSDTYNMTKIGNTNNLYCYTSGLTYNDFTQFCFIGNSSHWGQYNDSPNNRKGSATTNTDNYQVNMDHSSRQYNLFIPAGTTKGTSLTHSAYGDYTSLNYTQTVEQKLSENGGDSYSTSTRALATVSVNSYKLTSATGTTADGGSIASGQSSKSCDAARTATVTYSVSSVAEGYTFVGWYDGDTEKSTSTTYTYQATEARTITARFKANAYSVVFDGNDKTSGTMSNQTFYYNVAQNLTTNAYGKNGYNFGGWTTNNDGTGSSYTNGQSVSNWSSTDGASITIFAKWTQSITLDRESGTSGSTSVTATYNSATLGSYDNPERTGYTFGGYYSGDDATGELIINTSKVLQANKTDDEDVYTGASGIWKHAGATTLHAKWTAKEYTINLANMEADEGYEGTTSVTVTFDASTNMTASDPITKPTKTNYDFGGYWVRNEDTKALVTKLIDEDGKWIKDVEGYTSHDGSGNPTWVHDYPISLYAKWTEHEYAVTLAVSPAGTGTTNPASSTTAKYVTASGNIEATANSGYSFREWGFSKTDEKYDVYVSDDKTYSSTDAIIKINAQHNGTLTANFIPNTYTVRFENQSADTGYEGSSDTTVTFNDTINMKGGIEKPRKRHYVFGGYYISTDKGVSLTNTQIIDADGKWNKDVSGYTGTKDGVASWVCAADTVLYAKWTDSIYTVAVQVSPAGAGEVRVSGSAVSEVTAGFTVRSSEMTPVGASVLWKFKEWRVSSDDCVLDLAGTDYHRDFQPGTDNKMKITARATGQTLTAVFEPRYYFVGGEIMSGDDAIGTGKSSGMPGWDNYDVPFNVITNTPIHATCSLTLTSSNPTANYLIEVRDRVDGLSYGKSAHLGDGDTITFDTRDVKVTFQTNAGTAYTFAITGVDANDRPKVSVERPHQVNFGRKYINIGGSPTDGDVGGTVAVTKDADASNVSNGAWLPYGTAVTYTATPTSGYKVDWYTTNDYATGYITSAYTFKHAGTSTGNGYVMFTELATEVTLSNDGHGHIEIVGETAENTTCGVTTTRSLTAVPNTGYSFSSWTKVSGDDITISPTDVTPTTLTGKGSGLTTGQTVTANFTAKTYTVTLDDDHGGSNNGSATATYDATTIDVSSDATFSGWTLVGYWNKDGNQVTDESGNLLASVLNYTSASNEWKYDGDVNLWAHWSRSITLDDNGGSADGLVTVTYKGTAGTPSAPTKTGYHVEAYYAEVGCTNKVMEANGTLVNYTGYVADGKWTRGETTTLYAKWEPNTYTVTLHNDHGGESSDDGTATATYDATTLAVSSHATFSGWTLLGYWNSSAKQVADENGNLKASVDGFTDSNGKWTKTDNADVWAHWTRTITLDDNVSQQHNGSVSVTYKGAAASHSAPHAREGYTLDGYYNDAACTTKVMNNDGTLVSSVSGYTDATPNWIHKTAATLYAKWTSDHFIIYRTDDKSSDPRKLGTDVESYAGGTIDKAIEFRMKVRELDKWNTLCLPFTVNAVKVWDEEDCAYYPIVPYYRPEVGGTFYNGHYIIRTPDPEKRIGLPIAEFDNWYDPVSPTGYVPSKDVPYIIQWHDSYFTNRYISFFGATGQTIATAFREGNYADANDKVNVYGNNTMQSGSVVGAYMLDAEYGAGAWLRLEDASAARTILPFECFVRASETTTQQALVIRRDMIISTPTGFDTMIPKMQQTNKVIINGQLFIIRDNKMYNIYGKEVQQ